MLKKTLWFIGIMLIPIIGVYISETINNHRPFFETLHLINVITSIFMLAYIPITILIVKKYKVCNIYALPIGIISSSFFYAQISESGSWSSALYAFFYATPLGIITLAIAIVMTRNSSRRRADQSKLHESLSPQDNEDEIKR
jgi:MFS family permease